MVQITELDKITEFTVDSFDTLMDNYKEGVNTFLNSKGLPSVNKFDGGAYYLAFYPIAQEIINLEALFNKVLTTAYTFPIIANNIISRPNCIPDRFVEEFKKLFGVDCSFEAVTLEKAGIVSLAVDFNDAFMDNEENRLKVYEFMSDSLPAGLWFNGDDGMEHQIYATSYNCFASVRLEYNVRIRYKVKKNTPYAVMNSKQIKDIFLANFKSKYKLGDDFSDDEYLSYSDLPFTSYLHLQICLADTEAWEDAPKRLGFKDYIIVNEVLVEDITNGVI